MMCEHASNVVQIQEERGGTGQACSVTNPRRQCCVAETLLKMIILGTGMQCYKADKGAVLLRHR